MCRALRPQVWGQGGAVPRRRGFGGLLTPRLPGGKVGLGGVFACWPWLGVACSLVGLACGPSTTRAARSHARPWRADLGSLFDDQADGCVDWTGSEEVWAVNERTLHERRVAEADIVAVGTVRELVSSDTPGARDQSVFHFRVERLLRGTQPDLPGGSRDLVLPLSKGHEARVTRDIVGRRSVLLLRWLRTGPVPFHWHLACGLPGVLQQTRGILAARPR